ADEQDEGGHDLGEVAARRIQEAQPLAVTGDDPEAQRHLAWRGATFGAFEQSKIEPAEDEGDDIDRRIVVLEVGWRKREAEDCAENRTNDAEYDGIDDVSDEANPEATVAQEGRAGRLGVPDGGRRWGGTGIRNAGHGDLLRETLRNPTMSRCVRISRN